MGGARLIYSVVGRNRGEAVTEFSSGAFRWNRGIDASGIWSNVRGRRLYLN